MGELIGLCVVSFFLGIVVVLICQSEKKSASSNLDIAIRVSFIVIIIMLLIGGVISINKKYRVDSNPIVEEK